MNTRLGTRPGGGIGGGASEASNGGSTSVGSGSPADAGHRKRPGDSLHRLKGLKGPAVRRKASLHCPDVVCMLALCAKYYMRRESPTGVRATPQWPPSGLHRYVVARHSGRPPPELLAKLQRLLMYWLAVQSLARRLAVLPHEALAQNAARMFNQPRNQGGRKGYARWRGPPTQAAELANLPPPPCRRSRGPH